MISSSPEAYERGKGMIPDPESDDLEGGDAVLTEDLLSGSGEKFFLIR